MEIEIIESSLERIPQYLQLYKICFPNARHFNEEYLTWLYAKNPCGKALGADVIIDEKVVGHVIGIPGKYYHHGALEKGLLAVNSAVHPAFQGRMLFKKLGLKLCEYATNYGYSFIIGVSNSAATPIWIRKMNFQLVSPLEARVGIGNLSLEECKHIIESSMLRQSWTPETLNWRSENPHNKVHFQVKKDQFIKVYASTGKFSISVVAEILFVDNIQKSLPIISYKQFLPKLFIGLIPRYKFSSRYFKIPQKLKPSPLNLIYKDLSGKNRKIDPNSCFINFLDFDAF